MYGTITFSSQQIEGCPIKNSWWYQCGKRWYRCYSVGRQTLPAFPP
jgi:hypothetical protein